LVSVMSPVSVKSQGPARALVVDLLALREQLEPVHRVVDLGPWSLGDLADIVLDRRARGLARTGHGKADQARVIVALRRVRIHLLDAQGLGEALVGGGVHRRRRRDGVDAVGDLDGQRAQELGIGGIALGDALTA
jgi:hypothetical protein